MIQTTIISMAVLGALYFGYRAMMRDHLRDKQFRKDCKPGDRCAIFDRAGDKVIREIVTIDTKGERVLVKDVDTLAYSWHLIETICAV